MLLLLLLFGVLTAVLHLIGRYRWTRHERELADELERARAELDRANLFLASEPQIVVAWDRPDAEPRVEGEFALVTDAPNPRRVLAFAAWLEPALAAKAEEAVGKLLSRGEAFSLTAAGLKGRHFEIFGRAIAGNAVMRIRDISGDRLQLVRLHESHARSAAALDALRKLLDATPNPAWTRDRDGAVDWVNAAYARAVEADGSRPTRSRNISNCSIARAPGSRRGARAGRALARRGRRRSSLASAGCSRSTKSPPAPAPRASRSTFPSSRRCAPKWSAMSAPITACSTNCRPRSRSSTASKRLSFYNAAYRQIWSLDPAFLEQRPTDGEILDRLRAKRQLPEQADFRSWKAQTLAAYQAIEPVETVWHLPDGRALRVVASPNPQGGVTYLFDDATQSFALASQLNALTRVQGETLDALKEGVAVFGADGRLKLINPAFASLWRFDPAERDAARPHIDEVAKNVPAV